MPSPAEGNNQSGVILGRAAFEEMNRKVNAGSKIMTDGNIGLTFAREGMSLDLGAAGAGGVATFRLNGTWTAGGVYTASKWFPTCQGANSNNTTIGTTAMGVVNNNGTFALWSANEIGGSFHLFGTNSSTYITAIRTGGGDVHMGGGGIWLATLPLPPLIPVKLLVTGGTNGTASGGVATFATLQYTMTDTNYGQTLGTGVTLFGGSIIAGTITPAISGWAEVSGTGASTTFTLIGCNERELTISC